ncbi:hypothetical protein G6F43_012776 [Rhizopus delemar]|nr:hypothetical protein G6F43_012776 [Rhizopus delemar]
MAESSSQSKPYLPPSIIKIPEYSRNVDPARWIKLFEANVEVVGATTDDQKLLIVPGYFKSDSITEWFTDQDFDEWETFKKKFTERYQSNKEDESMRDYVDRYIHGGIKPVSMKMLVKRHLPATLSEAQTIAITESDEVEEGSDVGSLDLDSESDGEPVSCFDMSIR